MFKKIAYSFFLISFLFSSTSLANPIYTSEDLIRAIIVDNPNRVQFILDSQPTLVNSLSEEGTLPLNVAVADENTEMVDLLMKNGADPKLQDIRGLSALKMAESEASPLILDTINSYYVIIQIRMIKLHTFVNNSYPNKAVRIIIN
jgi:ankyrin repeat protein